MTKKKAKAKSNKPSEEIEGDDGRTGSTEETQSEVGEGEGDLESAQPPESGSPDPSSVNLQFETAEVETVVLAAKPASAPDLLPPSIPIFDIDQLKENFSNLGEEIFTALRTEVDLFLEENKGLVSELGKDVVAAIFTHSVFDQLPRGTMLPANATPEMIATKAELGDIRSQAFQLITKAELSHRLRVAEAKKRANKFAQKFGFTLIGLILKTVLGVAS